MTLRASLPVVLFPLLPLEAATILDPLDTSAVTDADYRAFGEEFTAVGLVNTDSFFDGSGTLIGDRWVLTAGHVTPSFTGSASVRLGETNYSVSRIITHPGYTFALSATANDLALLELASPVTGISPMPILRLSAPFNVLGEEAIWVGSGSGGTGLTGQQSFLAGKRAFTNVIDWIGAFGLPDTSFIADFDRPDGSENIGVSDPFPTMFEGNSARGDSGGGVFLERDGVRYLIGLHSYQASIDGATDADYRDLSGGTNLALYYDWIESVTGIAIVPEPATGLLCALLMPVLAARRRRVI